jgi:glucan 1,3-beta-glucosidase
MKFLCLTIFLIFVLCENQKIRGVNLGGWLLLEPWITPSIFENNRELYKTNQIIDEYSLCKILGKEKARDVLEKHWNSFCTKNDIKELSEMGFYSLNNIRN